MIPITDRVQNQADGKIVQPKSNRTPFQKIVVENPFFGEAPVERPLERLDLIDSLSLPGGGFRPPFLLRNQTYCYFPVLPDTPCCPEQPQAGVSAKQT